ncbi:hypothetical protein BGU81_12680 [Clostridioides difficile]|nr:hypothetical protein BGU81_12680 [Clostridioides difficile]
MLNFCIFSNADNKESMLNLSEGNIKKIITCNYSNIDEYVLDFINRKEYLNFDMTYIIGLSVSNEVYKKIEIVLKRGANFKLLDCHQSSLNIKKVIIPNSFINKFDVISDGAVRIYLVLKLAEQLDGIKEFTRQEIQNYLELIDEDNMSDLIEDGYLCKRRVNRNKEEEYVFYINPYFSSIDGFTMLENSVISLGLTNLTDGEIKLYTYLCFMIGSDNKDYWASPKYLAKKIGKMDNSVVSKLMDSLVRKKYITKKQ